MPLPERPALLPVPVVRARIDGPHTIELVLAVGCGDEPAHLAGITHLAEHLLIRLAGPGIVFLDGRTTVSDVTFTATASADDAAAFVTRLCRAIADVHRLTDAQVALELDIMQSEDPVRFADVMPSAATVRFGFGGAGLDGAGTPALGSVTRDEVVAWVRERFTADRALVLLTGPWAVDPPAFVLPAAPAAGIARPPAVRGTPTPVAVTTPRPGVTLSVVVPAGLALALDHAVEHDAFQDLRLDRGLAYTVEVQVERIDADTDRLDLIVLALPPRVRDAVVAVVGLGRRIAADGFSELAVAVGRSNAVLLQEDATRMVQIRAQAEARALLLGEPVPDVDAKLRTDAGMDGETLRRAWAEAFASAVVLFDEDADTGEPEVLARELGMPVDDGAPAEALSPQGFDRAARGHRTWRSGVLPGRDRTRIALADDRLLLRVGDAAWAVDLARVVVATVGDDDLVLVSEDGRLFRIGVGSVRQGAELREAVVARLRGIAPERVRRVPDRP